MSTAKKYSCSHDKKAKLFENLFVPVATIGVVFKEPPWEPAIFRPGLWPRPCVSDLLPCHTFCFNALQLIFSWVSLWTQLMSHFFMLLWVDKKWLFPLYLFLLYRERNGVDFPPRKDLGECEREKDFLGPPSGSCRLSFPLSVSLHPSKKSKKKNRLAKTYLLNSFLKSSGKGDAQLIGLWTYMCWVHIRDKHEVESECHTSKSSLKAGILPPLPPPGTFSYLAIWDPSTCHKFVPCVLVDSSTP